MQVREQRAQRERRRGVVARKARKALLAKLRADGFFARFELKAVLAAFDRAGQLIAKVFDQLTVVVSTRAQHRLGGGETG